MNTTAAKAADTGSIVNRVLWIVVLALGAYCVIKYVQLLFTEAVLQGKQIVGRR